MTVDNVVDVDKKSLVIRLYFGKYDYITACAKC